MITAGIDVGLENIKVVILQDGKIIGRGIGRTGGAGRAAAIESVMASALQEAKIEAGDVEKTIATGKGRYDAVTAGEQYTEPVTAVRAARFLHPDADAVVDAGADETLIASMERDGRIKESTINQKCAAGIGTFLRNMADRLEMSLEELSALPPADPAGVTVSDGCVVFGEMDALSCLNHGASPKEVAEAVIESAAIRACSVIKEPTLPIGDRILLVGGLAKNAAFVAALEKQAGLRFIIPADAEYAGALGAALTAIPLS
ncbi:MAG: acyl-CoA dehydratase activase [Clostridiales bacterium]|nr:acyl-CoA dehydratase activase [Clostridiales bacterium]